MMFVWLLFVAIQIHQTDAETWDPCNALPSNRCYSTAFNELSTNFIGSPAVETSASGAGQWALSNGVLRETSRTASRLGSNVCTSQLGQVFWLHNSLLSPLDALRQIRVKVRVTASTGSAGFIFSEKDATHYFRFQSTLNSQCPTSGALVKRTIPNNIFQTVKETGHSMEKDKWVELRARVFQMGTRVEFEWIEQTPSSIARASTVNRLMDYSLVGGGRIGLWCSASGPNGGCEFDDLVVVSDAYRGSLIGPLDCQACNLIWPKNSESWCRCCQQDCSPFEKAGCLRDGLCNTLCTTTQWCNPIAPPTPQQTPIPPTPVPPTPVPRTPMPTPKPPTPLPTPMPPACNSCQYRTAGGVCAEKCSKVTCTDRVAGWAQANCQKWQTDASACENGVCPSPNDYSKCQYRATLAPFLQCGSVECIRPGTCQLGLHVSNYKSINDVCMVNQQAGCGVGKVCDGTGTCVSKPSDGTVFTPAPTPPPTPQPTPIPTPVGATAPSPTTAVPSATNDRSTTRDSNGTEGTTPMINLSTNSATNADGERCDRGTLGCACINGVCVTGVTCDSASDTCIECEAARLGCACLDGSCLAGLTCSDNEVCENMVSDVTGAASLHIATGLLLILLAMKM